MVNISQDYALVLNIATTLGDIYVYMCSLLLPHAYACVLSGIYLCVLKSCAGRVNLCRLRVPAFVGWVWEPTLLCMRVRGGNGLYLV